MRSSGAGNHPRPAIRPGNVAPAADPTTTTRVVEFNDLIALERELSFGDVAAVFGAQRDLISDTAAHLLGGQISLWLNEAAFRLPHAHKGHTDHAEERIVILEPEEKPVRRLHVELDRCLGLERN